MAKTNELRAVPGPPTVEQFLSDNGQGAPAKEKLKCGIVMPISAIDGLSEAHWLEVKAILTDAIESVGFSANLVSYADDVGIIQKTIVQNLYENPIVVCDVSGKNPNVMFELGMRLAFDKPTVIVKDDKTSYSFDTSPIQHVEYPRDLRYAKINEFKRSLAEKVQATYEKATTDKNYTTFLGHFGKFTVAKLDTHEVSKEDFIIEQLKEMRQLISRRDASVPANPLAASVDELIYTPEVLDHIKTVRKTMDATVNGYLRREGRMPAFQAVVDDILKKLGYDQLSSAGADRFRQVIVRELHRRHGQLFNDSNWMLQNLPSSSSSSSSS